MSQPALGQQGPPPIGGGADLGNQPVEGADFIKPHFKGGDQLAVAQGLGSHTKPTGLQNGKVLQRDPSYESDRGGQNQNRQTHRPRKAEWQQRTSSANSKRKHPRRPPTGQHSRLANGRQNGPQPRQSKQVQS